MTRGKSGEYRQTLLQTATEIMKGPRQERIVFDEWKKAYGGRDEAAKQICSQMNGWGRCALPMIQLNNRLAASLASTSVSEQMANELSPPWSTFSILAPAGSICEDEMFIVLSRGDGFWCLIVATSFLSIGALRGLGEKLEDHDHKLEAFDLGPEQADAATRIIAVAQRISIGVILESINIGLGSHSQSSRGIDMKVKRGAPVARVFQMGRPVVIDARKQVREFIETGRVAPTVQTLVRGHYKMQPHGEGRAQRKYIHVEPYWRGPEDAPIVVRPHILKDSP